VAWVKALGANPTPMPFPEVYGGLEQKAIDGQENPVAVIASSKFFEVQKHIVLSNHQYNPQSVVMSKKFWDSLSPAEKKIVDEAADEAAKTQREAGRAALAANLDTLRKNGMQVTQFAPAEVAKLREKMKPVITQFTANVGEATVSEVMAELAKMRR
jgi:TRAP-type C4-dicarboxylate transport system substrate-binding protein